MKNHNHHSSGREKDDFIHKNPCTTSSHRHEVHKDEELVYNDTLYASYCRNKKGFKICWGRFVYS
jgi:hypothetical protein